MVSQRGNSNRPVGIESIDHLLSILSDECNRYVLEYFQTSSDTVAQMDDLVDYAEPRCETPSDDSDRVAIHLHHCSLPKLSAVGLLDYDPRHGTVRYCGHPTVDRHLELLDQVDVEW